MNLKRKNMESLPAFRIDFFFAMLLFSLSLVGCSAGAAILSLTQSDETLFAEAEQHRETYLRDREPESIRWLLSNRARNGMGKTDIDQIIGEQGGRVFDDSEILANDGLYRADDLVYSWGPDKNGNSYWLVFRDNHLVNFENFNKQNSLPEIDNSFE